MTSSVPEIPTGELVQALSAELSALVRQELQRIQQDYLGKARRGRTGVRMIGGAVVLGSMATEAATDLVIRLQERRSAAPPAVTAAVFGAAAAALAAAGRMRLRQAWSPLPRQTVTGLPEERPMTSGLPRTRTTLTRMQQRLRDTTHHLPQGFWPPQG
jgi:Putative Actinobacterial Holin-X, holin superfamily III